MAKQYETISPTIQEFIKKQKLFFVGTAAAAGRVNVSPKGMDSLRVINENKVVWLNLTGSGNETAAHILEKNRMTIMFCSFDKKPLILRLYGTVNTMHPNDSGWEKYIKLFPTYKGARQIFELHVDLVQTSCGFAVPQYDFVSERDMLTKWAENKGEDGIKEYWQKKNVKSLDGYETGIT